MPILDRIFTAQGSPNIAFVKYWGKRDERLILPYNSSISMTLDHAVLRTVTSVMLSEALDEDVFYLGGKPQDLGDRELKERMQILEILRKAAGSDARMLIASHNHFPTASGMASSASGIATLVYAANAALQAGLNAESMSIIARQGSGSACRSMLGGIVMWRKGTRADGSDSYAQQLFAEDYWPEVVDNIVVVSQSKKKVSSRAGMKQTADTNPLFRSRPESAEARARNLIEAYKNRDMGKLAQIIMAESNEMHALMLSTVPSIRYLNTASYALMDAVEQLNMSVGETICGYTFDAGPNANIITTQEHQPKVSKMLKEFLEDGSVQYVKTSKVGSGPKMLDDPHAALITKDMVKEHIG